MEYDLGEYQELGLTHEQYDVLLNLLDMALMIINLSAPQYNTIRLIRNKLVDGYG